MTEKFQDAAIKCTINKVNNGWIVEFHSHEENSSKEFEKFKNFVTNVLPTLTKLSKKYEMLAQEEELESWKYKDGGEDDKDIKQLQDALINTYKNTHLQTNKCQTLVFTDFDDLIGFLKEKFY